MKVRFLCIASVSPPLLALYKPAIDVAPVFLLEDCFGDAAQDSAMSGPEITLSLKSLLGLISKRNRTKHLELCAASLGDDFE